MYPLLSSARTFTLAFALPKHEILRSSSHEEKDVGPDSGGIPEAVAAAQGSEHELIPSPWHWATAPGPAPGGGEGCFHSQAAFIAKAELFSHHKSLKLHSSFCGGH